MAADSGLNRDAIDVTDAHLAEPNRRSPELRRECRQRCAATAYDSRRARFRSYSYPLFFSPPVVEKPLFVAAHSSTTACSEHETRSAALSNGRATISPLSLPIESDSTRCALFIANYSPTDRRKKTDIAHIATACWTEPIAVLAAYYHRSLHDRRVGGSSAAPHFDFRAASHFCSSGVETTTPFHPVRRP